MGGGKGRTAAKRRVAPCVACCAVLFQDFLDRKETMENELGAVKAELAAKIKDYEYRLTCVR